MNIKALPPTLFVLGLGLAACGSDDTAEPTPDAGVAMVEDMGTTMPADAGVRTKCPIPENSPSCEDQVSCLPQGDMRESPQMCGSFCAGYASYSCTFGRCEQPTTLTPSEPVNLRFDVKEVLGQVDLVIGMVVQAETTGGASIDCTTVAANPTDFFQDSCYNVTDERAFTLINTEEVYTATFSSLVASRDVLFVLYGFNQDTTGSPVGVSCTEYSAPASGSVGAAIPVEGNPMTLLP